MVGKYFKHDSFKDFKGVEHKFTVALVIEHIENAPKNKIRLATGVSVCCEKDEWNEETGKMISANRASAKHPESVYSSALAKSLLTDEVIQDALTKEADFVRENPGVFIKGYDQAKKRYLRRQKAEKLWVEMTEEERNLLVKLHENKFSDAYNEFVKGKFSIL